MKTEHRQAQVALKRSKTVDCACHPYSDAVRRGSVADVASLDTSADYKILGVGKDATEVVRAAVHFVFTRKSQLTPSLLPFSARLSRSQEIKKAYRKQSLVHHPDKGGTEEKFKEVSRWQLHWHKCMQ